MSTVFKRIVVHKSKCGVKGSQRLKRSRCRRICRLVVTPFRESQSPVDQDSMQGWTQQRAKRHPQRAEGRVGGKTRAAAGLHVRRGRPRIDGVGRVPCQIPGLRGKSAWIVRASRSSRCVSSPKTVLASVRDTPPPHPHRKNSSRWRQLRQDRGGKQ